MSMNICSIGFNYSHDNSFVMDRPMGPGTYLLLLMKTTARVTINNDIHNTEPVTFVLFSPTTPCRYTGRGQGYTDDWIYLEFHEGDRDFVLSLDIPFDTPVYIGESEELSEIIHILAYEHYSGQEHRERIEEDYLRIFMYKLSRFIHGGSILSTHEYTEKNHRMTQLRSELINNPDRVMNVDEMAASLNMSRSSFQHTYKRMFGSSVIKDVTAGRMERAKRLLSSTNLTVAEIAAHCGYSSDFVFIRRFKAVCGQTPTEYRRCIGSK
ncbi:MAG: helix-turn-helix transcriptional regulator [Oscillospiraceae bacterium]|nr:helix-turn-helix transcriptional regulator [Oscillospiraceae bacterium]